MNEQGDALSVQGKNALIKVAEWLERGAPHVTIEDRWIDTFDMGEAVTPSHEDDEGNACGTACCIAGAVYQFENLHGTGKNPKNSLDFFHEVAPSVIEYLGITEEQATPLFLPWEAFEGESVEFSDPLLAGKVVRNFIETGVVDWNINGDLPPLDVEDYYD